MRAVSRLLAAVKNGNYLEPGAPTGLTGLLNHPSPRSTLVYLYSSTLDKLQQIPESSVYRQATEALTKHRLAIVEAAKPAGYDAWTQLIQMQVADHPKVFDVTKTSAGHRIRYKSTRPIVDPRRKAAEWDGETQVIFREGVRTLKERTPMIKKLVGGGGYDPEYDIKEIKLAPEPQLTAEQISEIESQIGAGLIEEVIEVAKGEHKLADEMIKAKVWEELEEKAPEGQWEYYERGGHTKTQKP